MAVLAIGPDKIWGGSASVLRFIAEKLEASGRFPRHKSSFDDVEAGWQDLDFSDLDDAEREALAEVAAALVAEVKTAGADAYGGPEHFPGLLARLEDFELLACGEGAE
jgi:hypothetical protein